MFKNILKIYMISLFLLCSFLSIAGGNSEEGERFNSLFDKYNHSLEELANKLDKKKIDYKIVTVKEALAQSTLNPRYVKWDSVIKASHLICKKCKNVWDQRGLGDFYYLLWLPKNNLCVIPYSPAVSKLTSTCFTIQNEEFNVDYQFDESWVPVMSVPVYNGIVSIKDSLISSAEANVNEKMGLEALNTFTDDLFE